MTRLIVVFGGSAVFATGMAALPAPAFAQNAVSEIIVRQRPLPALHRRSGRRLRPEAGSGTVSSASEVPSEWPSAGQGILGQQGQVSRNGWSDRHI